MKIYTVEVTRTVSFTKSYEVLACNEKEAEVIAETMASDDEWNDYMNGQEPTYFIEAIEQLPLNK